MTFWLVVAAVLAGVVGRLVLAKRARARFCAGECVTLALRLDPAKRGWKHGFARRQGDVVEWRAEYKLGPGADLTFDLPDLQVTDHRPVVRGEAMLSDRCELVFARYRGERVDLAVPANELPTFLGWVEPA